jgi:UDP-galactopyranose mutase
MEQFDLIVISHLRWSFVWQRPQQLLSRLAQRHRILFVEEPIFGNAADGPPVPALYEAMPNVTVLVPRLLEERCGGEPLWLWPCRDEIVRQVRECVDRVGFRRYAVWLYTPTPEFLAEAVRPEMLVYDVMDELANFRFAPSSLRDQERRLLARSAVVFTGGASLYDAKRRMNPNTHLFASGVDAAHYELACDPATAVPDWLDALPRPRATYIGVIDERLDYGIIAHMAASRPDVQFVMCGPIVKVDPAHVPHAANVHYPGQQQYADLPRILKGSDVCLMPFARNEATKFISPTKTLEYMATHRPIVSTPIRDVERFYSDIVYLADTPEQFVAKVGEALSESAAVRERNRRRELKILAEQAWDAIADNMETLMQRAWAHRAGVRAQPTADVSSASGARAPSGTGGGAVVGAGEQA